MDVRQRIEDMGNMPALLGAWVVIASVGEIVRSFSAATDGEVFAFTRIGLAVVGLVGAALLWSGRNFGRDGILVILAWGVAQIPSFANEPDVSFTRQLIDIFMGATTSTTVNGVVTEYSQAGINLLGVAVVAWANVARKYLNARQARTGFPGYAD